jgi:Xaa-Pro aminopeptidase
MRSRVLHQKLADFVRREMRRREVSMWLILTREGAPDPMAAHFGGAAAVGRMAIAIRPHDDGVSLDAVCASYDVSPLEESGLYETITPYGSQGWLAPLAALVRSRGEGSIAVDVSADVPAADGLSYTLREELLRAGVSPERLVSAQSLVEQLLGRKTEWEIERIRKAAMEAEEILRWALTSLHIVPDQTTEHELAERITEEVERRGHGFAWERPFCPSVQFEIMRGHTAPGNRTVGFGGIVAVDFGVTVDGYASDLQRTLVITREGEIPERVSRLWDVALRSVRAGAAVMRPGVTGLEVDRAARAVVHEAGCPDYEHATGHPLGYGAHDVGPMLGPDWPGRYGDRVHERLESGMVFTLEPGAGEATDRGLLRIGLEEDVVVRDDGVEYLAPPQTELWTLDA